MSEIYNYSKLSVYFIKYMRITFKISIILLTVFLIFSLILWLVGVKIKSEKAIKIGIRLSLSMIVFECLMFGVIIFIAHF